MSAATDLVRNYQHVIDDLTFVMGSKGVFDVNVDGVDIYWFAPSGDLFATEGMTDEPPEFLRSLAVSCEGIELKEGWTLVSSRGKTGTLAVHLRRDLDPAEEQLLRGFLRVLRRPSEERTTSGPDADPDARSTESATVGLVGKSSALAHVMRLVERVAPTDVSVLLLGENGTGKELVAQALHDRGPRSDRPFVAVN